MDAAPIFNKDIGLIDQPELAEIPRLIDIDKRAGQMFGATGLLQGDALDDHVPHEIFEASIPAGHVFTARNSDLLVVGFTLTSDRGKSLYLDQISVDPEYGRRGIGRSLIDNVVSTARARKKKRIVLSTFKDVPWNGPFYRSCGFKELPRRKLETWMLDIERLQAPDMDVTKRCFMARRTGWI